MIKTKALLKISFLNTIKQNKNSLYIARKVFYYYKILKIQII